MSPLFTAVLIMTNTQTAAAEVNNPGASRAITITPVSTRQIQFTDDILGLSFDNDGWPRLLAVSGTDDMLFGLEPVSMDSLDQLPLSAMNQNPWGVAFFGEELLYTNDQSDTSFFGYDSENWFTQENGAGQNGRGMDYNDDLFWQTASQGSLHRVVAWDPMSEISTWSDISSYIPGQLSGITAFTEGTVNYLCVTTFDTPHIWVFTTDDREVAEYVGTASLPETASTSLGLTYWELLDTFYWSYTSGGSTYICRFDMVIDQTSLERNSWAGIKAQF